MGQWSFGASVRWFNFGLLAQYGSVLADTYLQFSWGAATFGRFYFGKNLNGAHLGIVAELLSVCVEDPVNLVRITRYSLAPEFEAGYRFAWSRVFVDIGGVIGPTIPLYWRSDVLPGNRRGPGSGEFYLGFFWAAKAQFGVFF